MKTLLKTAAYLTASITLFCSCSKTADTSPTNVPATGSINLSASEVFPNNTSGVWGTLYAIRSEIVTPTYGYINYWDRAEACFLAAPGSYAVVKGITLNNAAGLISDQYNVYRYNIDTGANYYYYNEDDTIGFDSSANWAIYGAGIIPDFNYSDRSPFPHIDHGSIINTTTVTNTQPLLININNVTITGADSIYITFPSYYRIAGKAYSVSNGTITINKSDLMGSYSYSFGRYLVISATKSHVVNIQGKAFMFVKEYQEAIYITVQ